MKLTEGKKRKLVPEGTTLGLCYAIIDIGTQTSQWKGKPKKVRKILFGFETPNEKDVFDEKKGEEPFSVWERFTASLSTKAVLRGFLESWRGRAFTDDEAKGFDPKVLLAKGALLNIIHKEGYANIKGIVKPPKGTEIPKLHNDPVFFSLEKEDFDERVFRALSPGLRDTIAISPEFKALGVDYKPGEDDDDDDDHPGTSKSDSNDTEW